MTDKLESPPPPAAISIGLRATQTPTPTKKLDFLDSIAKKMDMSGSKPEVKKELNKSSSKVNKSNGAGAAGGDKVGDRQTGNLFDILDDIDDDSEEQMNSLLKEVGGQGGPSFQKIKAGKPAAKPFEPDDLEQELNEIYSPPIKPKRV